MPIRLSPTIKNLLITYLVTFIIQKGADQFMGMNLLSWFGLIPSQVFHGYFWQIFTYSFLHADVMHLVLNAMVLVFLGAEIEAIWGRKKFLGYYFICTTAAGLFYLLIQLFMSNPLYLSLPMVGASGGIYALLIAYGILFADRQLLFMMMFPMQARQFIWVLAGIEFLQAVFSGQGGLSAIAHLSGMAAGFGLLWLQAKGYNAFSFEARLPPKKKAQHLRLIPGEKKQNPSKKDDGSGGPPTWH
jgi:membrane associated rhomboid family serine protease